jgi:hypothetical protein
VFFAYGSDVPSCGCGVQGEAATSLSSVSDLLDVPTLFSSGLSTIVGKNNQYKEIKDT